MRFDVPADTLDQARAIRHSGRLAAKAGTQSRSLGFLRRIVKAHVVASGPSRGAAWPAIDSRARHAKDELAVGGRIPAQHRLPAGIGRTDEFRFVLSNFQSILRHHLDLACAGESTGKHGGLPATAVLLAGMESRLAGTRMNRRYRRPPNDTIRSLRWKQISRGIERLRSRCSLELILRG